MKVIAVANQKGGVGKTTITREISACSALRGYNVLAIDCDAQGSLTSTWFEEIGDDWPMLSHVLLEPDSRDTSIRPLPLADAIADTPLDNLDLIPSDIRLARFELQPDYMTHRLKNEIHKLTEYDIVFIDCPPQLGKLLVSSFYAADYVLIPCESDVVGLHGLADLDYTILQVQENVNADLTRIGAVMNRYKPNRRVSSEARRIVAEAYQLVGPLFDTNIHDYAKITEAPSAKVPVVEYAPNHNAADQLWSLTEEFLDRIKMPRNKIVAVK